MVGIFTLAVLSTVALHARASLAALSARGDGKILSIACSQIRTALPSQSEVVFEGASFPFPACPDVPPLNSRRLTTS